MTELLELVKKYKGFEELEKAVQSLLSPIYEQDGNPTTDENTCKSIDDSVKGILEKAEEDPVFLNYAMLRATNPVKAVKKELYADFITLLYAVKIGMSLGYKKEDLLRLGTTTNLQTFKQGSSGNGDANEPPDYAKIIGVAGKLYALLFSQEGCKIPTREEISAFIDECQQPTDKETGKKLPGYGREAINAALAEAYSPIGSYVEIGSNERGIIIENNKDYILRPVVLMLSKKGFQKETYNNLNGKSYERDLKGDDFVHIDGCVVDKESRTKLQAALIDYLRSWKPKEKQPIFNF